MKKMMTWAMAAALIIGSMSVFTACGSDDDEVQNPPVQPEDDGGNSGKSGNITYISRSWDGTKVVDKEVTVKAKWLNAIQIPKGDSRYMGEKSEEGEYWYVTGNHTIEGGIELENYHTLNLILCDDATLRVKYIQIRDLSTLRIFGQKRGTGKLLIEDPGDGHCAIGNGGANFGTIEIHGGQITAKGGEKCAAIGESCYYDGSEETYKIYRFQDIKIYGGVINATGGDGAAGIGGSLKSYGDDWGNIYIYGGDILAKGGGYVWGLDYYGGAGIGGGCTSPIKSVNIYGGNVEAIGGSEAAGIGCGEDAEKKFNGKGVINIYGGKVVGTGKDHAAGIGGGDGVYLKKIFISGGEVFARGGMNAAAIGGGEGAQGGNIEITGGYVQATAGADGAGIGGGEDGDGGTITISGGTVYAWGLGYGAGIGGGQDGNSGKITITGGRLEARGGNDAAGIGTGEETTTGPNIKADNITISGGQVSALGKGKGAGIGAGEDAEVGTINISTESGNLYISARAGDDCDWFHGAIGSYRSDYFGTLNIGNGVKVIGLPEEGDWFTVPVAYGQVGYAQWRCHVQLATCDHPGYTAETCIFCKH